MNIFYVSMRVQNITRYYEQKVTCNTVVLKSVEKPTTKGGSKVDQWISPIMCTRV